MRMTYHSYQDLPSLTVTTSSMIQVSTFDIPRVAVTWSQIPSARRYCTSIFWNQIRSIKYSIYSVVILWVRPGLLRTFDQRGPAIYSQQNRAPTASHLGIEASSVTMAPALVSSRPASLKPRVDARSINPASIPGSGQREQRT